MKKFSSKNFLGEEFVQIVEKTTIFAPFSKTGMKWSLCFLRKKVNVMTVAVTTWYKEMMILKK